jgi:acetylglutamate kinase
MISVPEKTEVLVEALPYILRYEGKTFVVKYGGAAMVDPALEATFAQDVTLLSNIGIHIVVVHGGGKDITSLATKLGLPTRFVGGQRYTDEPLMDVVQMVLAGKINKDLVGTINRHGGESIGLCGIDAGLLRAERQKGPEDLGQVGAITRVNTGLLKMFLDEGLLPVIAPIGAGDDGTVYNINADVAAAAIASAISAEKLIVLSDVEGIVGEEGLIHSIDEHSADRLISSGIISGGMIPKVRSMLDAVHAGVGKAHIIDGRVKHSLLLEIFTDAGVGTELIHDVLNGKVPINGKAAV